MLEELRKYENLGTPGYFWNLFHALKKDDIWTEKDISSYFFNRIVDNRSIFDGCIPLLKISKIISINEKTKEIEIDFSFRNILYSEELCKHKLLEGILSALKDDENFYNIFSSTNSSYDLIYKTVQIDFSAFGLRYTNIRNLLIDFEFLITHPDFPQKKLIINPRWKKFFDKTFVSEIRRRKIGVDELKKQLEQQQINGTEAEKFVMEYELKRLHGKDGIEWIAATNASAGYDILSFNDANSADNDRYIEVKSYSGAPYFYWSKNEVNIAEIIGDKYYLYLVDRDNMFNKNYEPMIIKNPREKIFDNDKWNEEVQSWYFCYKE